MRQCSSLKSLWCSDHDVFALVLTNIIFVLQCASWKRCVSVLPDILKWRWVLLHRCACRYRFLTSVHLSTHLLNLPLALGGDAVCYFPQMAELNAFSQQGVAPLWCWELSGRLIKVWGVAEAVNITKDHFTCPVFHTHVVI